MRDASLQNLKNLYKNHYGLDLSESEARKRGQYLVHLMETVSRVRTQQLKRQHKLENDNKN